MKPEQLRRRWDDRAVADARFHIRADRNDWTDEAFLAAGETDVAHFVDPVLDQLPGRARAVDIGCGLGRLTRALATRFDDVDGVDISPEMIARAKAFAPPAPPNVAWTVCPGDGSLPIASDSVDFAFSYLVFQHLPTASAIGDYLTEVARILRRDGVARVQVNGARRRLHDRLSVGVERSDRMPLLHRKPRCKLDPHNHMGVVLTDGGARRLTRRAGLEVLAVDGAGTAELWLTARRGR